MTVQFFSKFFTPVQNSGGGHVPPVSPLDQPMNSTAEESIEFCSQSRIDSYTVGYGLGGKAQLVRNLPCMHICNLGSGFLATDYMSFLQSSGTEGQIMRPNRLSHIYIYRSLVLILCYL